MKFSLLLFLTCFLISISAYSQQGFLHANGQKIVDGNGQNVLLRGMGLGGWMLQEGYMMESSGFANTQHQLKAKIQQVAGTDGLNAFYDAWLANYSTKADVDSMAAMGFNSIRLPMHYNLFTLPIEEDPVAGQDTWLDKGFDLVDQLLSWCADNEVYLILDLHAAPGGQGKDAAISDYDSSKKSLWESAENRRKTVALWKKLAERYANEPWIGGYDLLNEPNWDVDNAGNKNGCNCNQNTAIWNLYKEIAVAIRTVDPNHMLIIEGNCWGNRYNGLPNLSTIDKNLCMSFHKYWSYNNEGSISGILNERKNRNVPIWLGESGENSNVWFTSAIHLMEENNIGWAWWPYKKISSVAGTVTIPKTSGYQKLLNYWGGSGSKPSTADATSWLLEQAEMLKLENCTVHPDVVDAMFRQAQGDKSPKPYKQNNIPGTIYAVDYDLGGNEYAYFDVDSADYHVSTDESTTWNQGYAYRNDAVDIESCSDAVNNGYSVGWTSKGEWLNYSVNVENTSAYNLNFRYAANGSAGQFHLELDGVPVCQKKSLSTTGGWSTWKSFEVDDLVLEAGLHQLKLVIDNAGFNINYLKFDQGKALSEVAPEVLQWKTDTDGKYIRITTNLGFNENQLPTPTDFELKINNEVTVVESVSFDSINSKVLLLKVANEMIAADRVIISYSGTSLKSPSEEAYPTFTNKAVENVSPDYKVLPTKIQAEDFSYNNGFELEDCTDTGGGSNLSYANPGDYADYPVYLYYAGDFRLDYRVASNNPGRFKVQLITSEGTTDLHTISASTGGWQTWKTQSATASLPKGKFTLRIYTLSGEFNLNWFQVATVTVVKQNTIGSDEIVFVQNNGLNSFSLINKKNLEGKSTLEIFDLSGRQWINRDLDLTGEAHQFIENINLKPGVYILKFENTEVQSVQKLWIR